MNSELDHLVVVAPTLAAGAAYIQDTLGVELQHGGSHPRMGTHNLLLSLGESTYLEVISIDPLAPPPETPRWFELDQIHSNTMPYLAAWVVRTQNVHTASAPWTSIVGNVVPMTRGALSWLITVTPDGSLPRSGAAPVLIEWQTKVHPAKSLSDVGCSLVGFEVYHPEPLAVTNMLKSLELNPPIIVRPSRAGATKLVAHIQTPQGPRILATG